MRSLSDVSFRLALALACTGCSEEMPMVSCLHQPIYFGSEVAGSVSPSPEQRLSIVRIDVEQGHLCSGVAVTPSWIVSARHCEVGVGASVTLVPDASDPTVIPVTETRVHPSRDVRLLRADLTSQLTFHHLIPLWRGDLGVDWIGKDAELAGFGRTEHGSGGDLRFATETIADVDSDTVTVDGVGKSGACSGDSGGPLLVSMNSRGEPALLGVLSTGSASCVGTDVYVRLDQTIDWLLSHVGSLHTTPAREVNACR